MEKVLQKPAGRLYLAFAIGLAALVFAALAVWALAGVAGNLSGETLRGVDRGVLLWVGGNTPALDGPMRAVTTLGYYRVVLPLLVLAAAGFYLGGRRLSALFLGLATTGGMVLTTTLKAAFGRARPELFDSGYVASFYSFPSGHATVAVAFYGTLTLLVAFGLDGWRRWCVTAAGLMLVLSIGFSRLYLGVHYPTDVLAGYLTALLWVASLVAAYGLWRRLVGGAPRNPGLRHRKKL